LVAFTTKHFYFLFPCQYLHSIFPAKLAEASRFAAYSPRYLFDLHADGVPVPFLASLAARVMLIDTFDLLASPTLRATLRRIGIRVGLQHRVAISMQHFILDRYLFSSVRTLVYHHDLFRLSHLLGSFAASSHLQLFRAA